MSMDTQINFSVYNIICLIPFFEEKNKIFLTDRLILNTKVSLVHLSVITNLSQYCFSKNLIKLKFIIGLKVKVLLLCVDFY